LTLADKYREEAEEARRMAGLALKEDGKASWLRLADEWNRLAQEADKHAGLRDCQGGKKSATE
jgi:hypothetical protein